MDNAFMDWILNFLDTYGRVATAIVLLTVTWRILLYIRGVVPVSIRAGRIRQNKVAIFADSNNYNELKSSLGSTKLFREGNFVEINTAGDIAACEDCDVFVMCWADFENDIDAILSRKTARKGLIVYAPFPVQVPPDGMNKLKNHNFVTLTNFRGRLITDLLAMAIVIRYAKK
jgi:hypothetical protein